MVGFADLSSDGISAEQQALLKSRNFSLRPLATSGHLDAWKVLSLTWQPVLLFIFVLEVLGSRWPFAPGWRYGGERTTLLVAYAGVALQLLPPTAALGIMLAGVAAARRQSRLKPSAVVYWTWWPFWRFALCVLAAFLGGTIADHLWYHQFYPHERLQRLQAYQGIDPLTVGGVRIQDAGVVVFNETAGVDRTRSGCLKNAETYCVAPILFGGEVPSAAREVPRTDAFNGATGSHEQVYDMFMAGTGCCDCPGEFRCGDWNQPLQTIGGRRAIGGIRVLEPGRRDFFRLAAQEWAATHGKVSAQPIFFEWVNDPVSAFQELESRGVWLWALALLVVPVGLVLAVVVLNGVLELLVRQGLACPLEGSAESMSKKADDEEVKTKYCIL